MRAWRFEQDGKSLLALNIEGRVTRWRGVDFQQPETVCDTGPNIDTACLSEDGRWLAASSTNGAVRVWDLPRRIQVGEFAAHTNRVVLERFLSQGTKLVVIHFMDSSFHEWDLAQWQKIRSWNAPVGFRPTSY